MNMNFLKKIALLSFVAVTVAGGFWLYRSQVSEGVYSYDAAIDRSFILDLFKRDWYWLISDYSPDYSPERMLDKRAPSSTEEYAGNLIIKTYRVKGKPVGFIAYYPKELLEGYILFLAIDKEYRSKGLARKLMDHAMTDLKSRGMRILRLLTRVDNERGRKLYTGLGFKQYWTDGAYVKYEKEVN